MVNPLFCVNDPVKQNQKNIDKKKTHFDDLNYGFRKSERTRFKEEEKKKRKRLNSRYVTFVRLCSPQGFSLFYIKVEA